MSCNIDLKALWHREETNAPDVKEIFERANKLHRKTRNRIWLANILLTLTAIYIIYISWHYQFKVITTEIGILLIIVAIVFNVVSNSRIIPLLFNIDMKTSSRQYLAQLIRIKQKQEFLNKTILTWYFILLSSGLFLYMLEFAARMTLKGQLLSYGITFSWIALHWFYLMPKAINKQQAELNAIIAKLTAVNGQLEPEEGTSTF